MAYVRQGSVDHLVYAVADLDAGIAHIERMLGVRAEPGGAHPGRGTHNALLSLGGGSYLEIIAPDPDQPDPKAPRPFGLDKLRAPRLVTWAVRVSHIEKRVEQARAAGYDPGDAHPMSRKLPSGAELKWQLTARPEAAASGIVPFLIEWQPREHPSKTAPRGAQLSDLQAEHPHPGEVNAMLEALGVELTVSESARPALIATMEGPNGTVVLT
ncbi:MAG: VOC family protein [Chloroflexota bacterium]